MMPSRYCLKHPKREYESITTSSSTADNNASKSPSTTIKCGCV